MCFNTIGVLFFFRLLVSLTTLFQSQFSTGIVIECASKAAQYILPNLPMNSEFVLIDKLHDAIINTISKYHQSKDDVCVELLLKVLPQLWKRKSTLCGQAIDNLSVLEFLGTKLSVLVQDENQVPLVLPYIMLLAENLNHWKSAIPALELAGVHQTLRAVLRNCYVLSTEELCAVLQLLCSFVDGSNAAHIQQYISEDMHTQMIIMVQEFLHSLAIQELTWRLMRLLCRGHKQFALALIETGLLHSIGGLMLDNTPIQLRGYLIEFLASIAMSFEEFNGHFFQVAGLVAAIASLVKNESLEERLSLMAVCIFARLTNNMTLSLLPEIMSLDLLGTVKSRALQYPEKYLVPACEILRNILSCGRNRSSMFGQSELPKTMFSEGHHLFYQEVLSKENITSDSKLTIVVLSSLNRFVRIVPQELFEETICTKPFVETLLSLFQTCKDPMVMYSIASLLHLLFYLLRSCKTGADVVYECNTHIALSKAFAKASTTAINEELLGLFMCIFILYNSIGKAEALLDVSLHKSVVEVAKKFGRFQCQKLADEYGRCILTITADKEFSKKLISLEYTDDIDPLISDTYCAPIFRSSLHAQGNLAICGADVKIKLIDDYDLHQRIITYIREHTVDGNVGVLSAACRVLHILAAGDKAKRLFIEIGCIEVLLRLVRLRKDDSEICWRPLGTLSSLGFTALGNRYSFIRHDIVRPICGIIRGTSTDKAKAYASLILLCICEREDGISMVRNSGVLEDLVNIIAASSNSDLQRWGSIVREKLSLYTITLPEQAGSTDQTKDPSINNIQAITRVVEEGGDFPSHGSDNLQHRAPMLDPRAKNCTPENSFCVGRLFGSTYGMCSNCDKDESSSELVMRVHDLTPQQYQNLINNGWYRRGGVKMFRLRENHTMSCCDWETRVSALEFDHTKSKSYRKVLRRMPDNIRIKTSPAYFNQEAFDLYNSYHVSKHDKAIKSEFSYSEHIVHSPYRHQGENGVTYGTFHQEYYLGDKLAAVGVIDVVPCGIVSVYMWYDNSKEVNRYSFGVYSAIKEIEYVCTLAKQNPDMKYYYLQGWNPNNKKLAYKADYTPVEFFCPCISTQWIATIDGVDRCIASKEKQSDNSSTTLSITGDLLSQIHPVDSIQPSTATFKVNANDVAVTSYEAEHGTINVDTIPVCLDLTQFKDGDTHAFMPLGEAANLYHIKEHQLEMMRNRYRELVVALGQPLAKQFYITLKVFREIVETSV